MKVKIYESREEWLKGRKNRIGGSDAAAVLGLDPYKSNIDLWELKTGRVEPFDISDNKFVRYGTIAEHYLREIFHLDYEDIYQVYYKENNLFLNDKYPFAHASLDGWLKEISTGKTGGWECKTVNVVSGKQANEWKDDKVPMNYYIQMIHCMAVTEFDFWVMNAQLRYDFGDGDITNRTIRKRIDREEVQKDIDYLMEKEKEFWKMVEEDRRPGLILNL